MTVDNGNFENIHHDINGNTLGNCTKCEKAGVLVYYHNCKDSALEKAEEKIKAEIGIFEEFISPNGITMIKGIKINWRKEFKYADGTGPWSLTLNVGDMSNMKGIVWKVNEDKVLSIFGMSYSSEGGRAAFKCNTLEEAEFFVQRYIEGNELGELGVLYQK